QSMDVGELRRNVRILAVALLDLIHSLLVHSLVYINPAEAVACSRLIGVQFESLLILCDRPVVLTGTPVRIGQALIGHWREWIQLQGTSRFGDAFVKPAAVPQLVAVRRV